MGLGVGLFGAAVLAAWTLDLAALGGAVRGLVSVHVNTGAAFALAGTALLLGSVAPSLLGIVLLRSLAAVAVLALALATLLEYGVGQPIGVNGLLLDAPRYAEPRLLFMPPLTAALFALGAAALLLAHARHRTARAVARTLAASMGLLGFLVVVGHLYGVPMLDLPFGGTAMSALAAAAFVMLAAGIAALRPEQGLARLMMRRSPLGAHLRWLFAAALVIPVLIGAVALQTYQAFGVPRLSIAVAAAGTTVAIGAVIWLAALLLGRAESRLEIMNRALGNARQGVLIADGRSAGTPIVYANDAFTAISGYSAKEALGRPCDFFAAGTAADAQELDNLDACLRDGRHCTAVFQGRRKNGTVFSCRLSMSGVPADTGGMDHAIALIEDVTAEQLAAKARLELLAEASQARKDAEAANRARDDFLASVTHDLRSPLNACLMWADVMALAPLSAKSAKAVEAIKRNLKVQARLVNDLIDTAKMASGGIELHVERVDVARLVEANLETWRLTAQAQGAQFRHSIEPGDYESQLDPERAAQVLNNLVENAFRSIGTDGAVELKLRAEGDDLLIEVSDDGCGLSSVELDMLFTPFWRGETAAKKHKGLGLAIAEHLVTRHHGTLHAASDGPGAGCTFTARFPRSTARYAGAPGTAVQ